MTWFNLTGDARLGRCDTEGCGGQPTWRLETCGIGSNYCSGCKEIIASPTPQCEVQSAVAITDEMIEEAIEAHVEPFDSGDAVGAMRAALTAALGAAQASTYRADAIEECARHLEREADVATNSLHCGDNSGTIAAVHRVSRVYYEAAKSLRAIKNDGIRTEPSSVPSAECK